MTNRRRAQFQAALTCGNVTAIEPFFAQHDVTAVARQVEAFFVTQPRLKLQDSSLNPAAQSTMIHQLRRVVALRDVWQGALVEVATALYYTTVLADTPLTLSWLLPGFLTTATEFGDVATLELLLESRSFRHDLSCDWQQELVNAMPALAIHRRRPDPLLGAAKLLDSLPDIAKVLVAHGCEIQRLGVVAGVGGPALCEFVIKDGAPILGLDGSFWRSRWIADDNAVLHALVAAGADPRMDTAFDVFPVVNERATLRLLHELAVDVDARRSDRMQWTLLMIAAQRNCAQVAAFLLERGANLWAQDSLGRSALTIAQMVGSQAVLDVVMAHQQSLRDW